MAFDWYRADVALCDHPKTWALEEAVGDPNAVAYLHRLWSWCVTYARDGVLRLSHVTSRVTVTVTQLERAMRWTGEPEKLFSTLVRIGWIDELENGDFMVHDWPEKQGKLHERAEKDRERQRRHRAKLKQDVTRDVTQTSTVTKSVHNETRRDVTERDEVKAYVEQARPAPVPLALAIVEPPKRDDAQEVFDHWKAVMASPRSILDEKRRKAIDKAIAAGATVAELQRAIDGCAASRWHMGLEPGKTQKHNGIELICRDRDHIEKFVAIAEGTSKWRTTGEHEVREEQI